MPCLLIADDEKIIRESIKLTLMGGDYEFLEADNLDQAYSFMDLGLPDIMLLDVHFKHNETCLTLLEKLKEKGSAIPIVILSGAASASEAAAAIKLGAYDFIEKPVSTERLKVTLKNALEQAHTRASLKAIMSAPRLKNALIGKSPGLENVRNQIAQFAKYDVKVLISGETGTGKEVVANAVWQASSRSDKPFVTVNSAAIPETLIESELFGHKKGAFTGAIQNQIGKIEMADGGTLFLDEIGELSLSSQGKLLRFLETGEIQVLGANKTKKCDVRLIAATSRDLDEEMKHNRFREDLYYRLNVARIIIPPLKDRADDIIPIFSHFVAVFCEKYQEPLRTITEQAQKKLLAYAWPGNIRELRNAAERLVFSSKDEITLDLVEGILKPTHQKQEMPANFLPASIADVKFLRDFRNEMEIVYINHVLTLTDNSVTKTASLLGLDRSHLHQKIRKSHSDDN